MMENEKGVQLIMNTEKVHSQSKHGNALFNSAYEIQNPHKKQTKKLKAEKKS